MRWKYWRDTLGKPLRFYDAPLPVEQLLLTKGKTDYLYYRHVLLTASLGGLTNTLLIELKYKSLKKAYMTCRFKRTEATHWYDVEIRLTCIL